MGHKVETAAIELERCVNELGFVSAMYYLGHFEKRDYVTALKYYTIEITNQGERFCVFVNRKKYREVSL